MIDFLRSRKITVTAGAVAVVAGLAWLAFGFFGVHTLFVDDVVDEAGPVFDAEPAAAQPTPATDVPATETATGTDDAADPTLAARPADAETDDVAPSLTPAPSGAGETTDAAPEIVTERSGTFVGDAHPTAGTATVLGNGTGQRFLRLEEFETDNGPDLNVYLFNVNGDRSDYIDLGDLKGNIGDQNYEIPADVDLDVYGEVSIWCVRFGVGFGSARLTPVA